MVCFCKNTMATLQLAMPQLNVSATADLGVQLYPISAWLARFGLPAAPWQPNPAWLDLQLPSISLNANAMATISAFAQLRAMVLAQCGIDLLVPAQATAFARLAATLQARLSAALSAQAGATAGTALALNASAWLQLSATLTACARIQEALALGLLPTPPPGPSLAIWRPFLVRLRALLPIIAASSQLGLDLSADFAAQLSAMLRVMLGITLPAFPPASLMLMANLTAALSAVAQIRLALGVDPLVIGLPRVQAMVAARVQALVTAIQASLGLNLASLLALLPTLPVPEYSASLMAPAAVVTAALRINPTAIAAINWNVPPVPSLPILAVGLPVAAFTEQLNAALSLTASVAPCGAQCDAAALMSASTKAAAVA